MALTDEQINAIHVRKKDGKLNIDEEQEQFLKEIGVPEKSIPATKANITRGTYDKPRAKKSSAKEYEPCLQKILRPHIEQLEQGLKITDGNDEKNTEAGRPDITAEDKDGNVVAIELKVVTAKKGDVGQVAGYMGALKNENKSKTVRGILIAKDFDNSAICAADVFPNIQLKKYEVKFLFKDIKLQA